MTLAPEARITDEPRFANLKVIDVDTHFCEPYDLWTSRVPAAYKDQVPRVERVPVPNDQRFAGFITGGQTEIDAWVIGQQKDFLITSSPICVIERNGRKRLSADYSSLRQDTVDPGAYDAKARVEVMDSMGVHAQIMYPNVAGGGANFFKKIDNKVKTLVVNVFNDAMAEFQSTSGDRVFPMAVLPWWDAEASVKEVERAHGMGMRGVVTTSDPHTLGIPHLGSPEWEPVWEVCQDLEMPVNFHIGSSELGIQVYTNASWPGVGPEVAMSLGSAALFQDNARVIGNLIYHGVPERFPRLKFVSVESGLSWIPFYLETLDHQAVETAPNELSHLTMKPSDYFRRNFYCSFWFESALVKAATDFLGDHCVMFETDYPHPTCLYPNGRQSLKKTLSDVSDETMRKIVQDNAAQLYRIPV